jgi:hypothetical protein
LVFGRNSFRNRFTTIFPDWVAPGFVSMAYSTSTCLNLGLGLAAIFALYFPQARVIQVVSLVMFVYSLPHYVYHLAHLSVLPTTLDQVANIVLLGLNVFIPLALLIVAPRVKSI